MTIVLTIGQDVKCPETIIGTHGLGPGTVDEREGWNEGNAPVNRVDEEKPEQHRGFTYSGEVPGAP